MHLKMQKISHRSLVCDAEHGHHDRKKLTQHAGHGDHVGRHALREERQGGDDFEGLAQRRVDVVLVQVQHGRGERFRQAVHVQPPALAQRGGGNLKVVPDDMSDF